MNLKLTAYPVDNGVISMAGYFSNPVLDTVKELLMHPDQNPDLCKQFWDDNQCYYTDDAGQRWYFETQDMDEGPDYKGYPIVFTQTTDAEGNNVWEEHYIPFYVSEIARAYVRQFADGCAYLMTTLSNIDTI